MDPERLIGDYEPLTLDDVLWGITKGRFKHPKWIYMKVGDPTPWQGDVIPSAELHYTDRNGAASRYVGPAMLLSHGCDAVPEQDPVAVMAPVLSLAELAEGKHDQASYQAAARGNRLSAIFYLPGQRHIPDRYVDFGQSSAVSTVRLQELFRDAAVEERTRLSMPGWWLLTGKLAYHVARKENPFDYPRDFLTGFGAL